jgi:hypothetical protein
MSRTGNDAEAQQGDGLERRSFLRGGLLLGAVTVGLTVASSTAFTEIARAASPGVQENWYWCDACAMIFYSASDVSTGACLQGHDGKHNIGTTQYFFAYNEGAIAGAIQANWTWCDWCDVLFYGPDQATSGCPRAYGEGQYVKGFYPHHTGSSTSYDVPLTTNPGSGYQDGWDYCITCRSLYHGSGQPAGFCVGTLATHSPGSTPYWVGEVQ